MSCPMLKIAYRPVFPPKSGRDVIPASNSVSLRDNPAIQSGDSFFSKLMPWASNNWSNSAWNWTFMW